MKMQEKQNYEAPEANITYYSAESVRTGDTSGSGFELPDDEFSQGRSLSWFNNESEE